MRRLALVLTLCASLAGCGDEAVVPVQAPPRAGRAEMLARLRGDDPLGLRQAALAIVTDGDPALRRAASPRLVAQAQIVTSPGFREWQRAQIRGLAAAASATAAQIEAEIDRRQDETLAQILAAMAAVGGPEVVAYCLGFAGNDTAPAALRKDALAVLVRHVDRSDAAAVARSAAIWERLK